MPQPQRQGRQGAFGGIGAPTRCGGRWNTLLAYAHGRPVQTQNVRVIRSIEDLSEEELVALAGMENGDDASVH